MSTAGKLTVSFTNIGTIAAEFTLEFECSKDVLKLDFVNVFLNMS